MSFIRALTKQGYSPAKLKALFESEDLQSSTDPNKVKAKALIDRHTRLVRDGLNENFKNANTFAAIDAAYDIGQKQVSATLAGQFEGKDPTSTDVLDLARSWGLDSMIVTTKNERGEEVKKFDLPVFFNIFVPMVSSYVKTRWSKLWTDRNTVPLYRYDPSCPTTATHAVCKIITNEIAVDAEKMGYRTVEREAILPKLLYGYSWTFARSDWFKEEGVWCPEGSDKVETYVAREGIQWTIIHPSKVFFDRTAPMNSINTDTGVRWCGYWSVVPFSQIDTDKYWNKDRITARTNGTGNSWVLPEKWKAYTQFYPCTLQFPWESSANAMQTNDRETSYYNSQIGESAVQVVTFFDKIIPKDYGLYDCEIPVWHMFLYAGDATIIQCVPFAYCPAAVDVYDYDSNRARNTSLAHELVPFQDMLGNLITQHLLSIDQNLTNAVFYNTEQVEPKHIELLENLGKKRLRKINFIPYSKRNLNNLQTTASEAFTAVGLPRHNTQELIGGINTLISAMERMLGFSPQEVGAAASHEQSATEVAVIDNGTSTRLALTGSFTDDARSARQTAAYNAWIEYGSREISQELSGITPIQIKALKDVGFTVTEIPGSKSIKIDGKRIHADIDSFTTARPSGDRYPDAKIAIAMLQAMQMIMGNPELVQRYGVDFIMERFNQILEYSGVPGDWRFDMSHAQGGSDQAQQMQQIAQFLQQALAENNQKISADIQNGIVKPMGEQLAKLGQGQQQLAQGLQQAGQQQQGVEDAVVGHQKELATLQQMMQGVMQNLQGLTQPPATAQIPAPPEQVNPEAVVAALASTVAGGAPAA